MNVEFIVLLVLKNEQDYFSKHAKILLSIEIGLTVLLYNFIVNIQKIRGK